MSTKPMFDEKIEEMFASEPTVTNLGGDKTIEKNHYLERGFIWGITQLQSELEAERAKVAKLKAELWVAKDSQLRTYDGLAQKADKYDEVVAENESLKRELWSLKEQDGRPYSGGNVAEKQNE